MKRAAVNLKGLKALEVEAKEKVKHGILLEEYLDLQKDFVSKKRKFQTAKQKRETLLAIVKFLRRKRRILLDSKISTTEPERNLVIDCENADRERSSTLEDAANEAGVRLEKGGERNAQREQVIREASRTNKKNPRNYFTHDKAIGKKKISWQDQVTLKV